MLQFEYFKMLQFDNYNLLFLAAQFCFIGFLIFLAVKTKSIGVIIIIISCIIHKIIILIMRFFFNPFVPFNFKQLNFEPVISKKLDINIVNLILGVNNILWHLFIAISLFLCYLEWKNGKFQFKR